MNDLQQTNVGTLLRNRRTELGLSLADIAARTHIRRAYLEALEEGRYEALPGLAYQKGFLRNYAAVLGLEADRVLRQWRNETLSPDDGRQSELSVAPPPSRAAKPLRRLPGRTIFLALLVLVPAVLSYVFFDHLHEVVVLGAASFMQEAKQAGVEPAPSVSVDSTHPPVAIALATETEVVEPAVEDSPAPAILPAIPTGGGQVRLEALGPLALEVEVDSRPLRRYVLNTASALQWDVNRSVRLAVDNPSAVKIWFGEVPLDLAGRSEIFLQAAAAE